MKKIPVIPIADIRKPLSYLMMALSVILSTSCTGNGNDRMLQSASQLIETQPEGALAVLEGVDYGTLCEDDKALFGLLFTSSMYRCSKRMESDSLIDRSIRHYREEGNLEALANSYYYKGCAAYVRGELKSSIQCFKQAEYLMDYCDNLFANKLYERLAYANYHSGCSGLALGYAQKFLSSSVELADSELVVRSLATIASCYYQSGRKDSAQYSISRCLPELQNVDKGLRAGILANLAQLCYDAGDDRQAEIYADSALHAGRQPFAYYVKGLIANRNGNPEKAKIFWDNALKTDDDQLKILLYGKLSALHASQNRFDEAYQAKDAEMHLARRWQEKADTEKIAELQAMLDSEQSKRNLYQNITRLFASAFLLAVAIAFLWLYHRKKARDYETKISDYSRKIDEYVEMLGSDSIVIHDYETQLSESHSQIGSLEKTVVSLQKRIHQQGISESHSKKEMDSMIEQLAQAKTSIVEKLKKGAEIYNAIVAKKPISSYPNEDLGCMVDFFKIYKSSSFDYLNNRYSSLSSRQFVFLIMDEMGYNNKEMARVMNVSETAVRTTRSRLKRQIRQ